MAVQTWIYGKPELQYEGCVLSTYEHNGYHDSDFYAICWDEDKQEVVHVEYDTTRCGGGGWAKVDATPDVLRKVYRHTMDIARMNFDSRSNQAQAKAVRKGDMVEVVRGRKVPKGTIGEVFWIGTRYNTYSRTTEDRVGIEVDGERMFLPLAYVAVIGWEDRLLTGKRRKEAIRRAAIDYAAVNYRLYFRDGRH